MTDEVFIPTRNGFEDILENKVDEILTRRIPQIIRRANRKEYLTTGDFKELFGVSSRLQKHYRDECDLPYIQENRKIFYETDKVEKWLAKREVNAGAFDDE